MSFSFLSLQTFSQNLFYSGSNVFMLLFFTAVFNPFSGWSGGGIAMVIVSMALLGILVLWHCYQAFLSHWDWRRYRIELFLCITYQLLCLLSLAVNYQRYEDIGQLIYYGIAPIVIWFTFPLTLLLFTLLADKGYLSLGHRVGWGVFVVLALVGLWQSVDYASTHFISSYFVSNEVFEFKNVSSLTRISTDFGPIMALALVAAMLFAKHHSGRLKWAYFALALLFFCGGSVSGSRNFLFISLFGVGLSYFSLIRRNKLITLIGLLVLFVIFSVLVINNDQALTRLYHTFPYLAKIKLNQEVHWNDLFFLFNGLPVDSGYRFKLWDYAHHLLKDNWLLGVSNGGFKLFDPLITQKLLNGHNLFIQTFIDGGLFGFGVVIALLWRLFGKPMPDAQKKMAGIVLLSLLFDYYLDHSLVWIFSASWLIILCGTLEDQSDLISARHRLSD